MTWHKHPVATLAATASLCLLADPTAAQFFTNDTYGYSSYGNSYSSYLAGLRIAMMICSVGLGFSIGWFLSPSARHLRQLLFWLLTGAVVFLAIINDGLLGWGSAWLVSFVGFFVALGYWLGRAIKSLGEVPTTFGSSRWATVEDIDDHSLYTDDGVRFGSVILDKTVYGLAYPGDRHLLTIAPTRSGKGTTQIIPNLLTYLGSTLVIDPKGENALVTAQARKDMGQEVMIVDPWGIAKVKGIKTAKFNPLDWLKLDDIDITENSMMLADALVVKGQNQDAFWDKEAVAYLQGLILYVATDPEEEGRRTLTRVRELTLLDGEDQEALYNRMLNSPHHIVASTGVRCLQKEEKLLASVIATAQSHTHFLDSLRIQENVSRSDFKFEDLKRKKMTVYLVLPADRLSTFAPWLRMLVQQALTVNARNLDQKPEKPVLFILDEMAALGRLSMVEQAYGLMAGYGIQLWGIIQDLNQLEKIYGKGWQSFISNTGMLNYFGSSDEMTAKYFSALCGETTVWNLSSAIARSFGTSSGQGGITTNSSTTTTSTTAASQRKLAYPDELMRMHKDKQLVFIENMPPLIAHKSRWFEDPALKELGVDLHSEPETEEAPA
ncbi:type IV secretory system conjugative DNA transfer family protein [Shimia sp. R9_2]|uniref:type IV secretory system conjugative DNA transfer family protein n=1 Tax=Shimia sp. R9_2 TaxID=2821112 RepID=UPI001ADCD252|nr:type IV secretory system conjugative DNA transfer family protein [Shimia sp. R9_2]MBO9399126.1 type IV secretory system conjugative DNA transfer family protein [Shimia sp. R9_2]